MAATTSAERVCIMGCGRVGAQLATHFFDQGYDVRVIDIRKDAFGRLPDEAAYHFTTVLGDGTDPAVLESAGILGSAIFIAVTNGDNRNIMAAQIAQQGFNIPNVICRIYDPKRHEIYKGLGVRSICPTLIGADAIYFDLTGEHLAIGPEVKQAVEYNHIIEVQRP